MCVKLVIYKDYTEMLGQQNIKESFRFVDNSIVFAYTNLKQR